MAITATGCGLTPSHAVGVVIDDGLVATVAHAVAGGQEITVSTADGRTLPGVIAAIDTGLDAALVRVADLDLAPAARRPYEDEEPVSMVLSGADGVSSTPVEVRRRVTVKTSDIYRQGVHLRPGLELTARVVPGDSGAGVFGADGRLLGVVWAMSRESADRAWATSIEAYEPLLVDARAGAVPPAAPCSR